MDVYLIFFLVTILLPYPWLQGYILNAREFSNLSELQTTREELKKIYGEEDTKKDQSFRDGRFEF